MRILKGMKDLYGVEIDKYEYITDTAKKSLKNMDT